MTTFTARRTTVRSVFIRSFSPAALRKNRSTTSPTAKLSATRADPEQPVQRARAWPSTTALSPAVVRDTLFPAPVLFKPFTYRQLVASVRDLLRGPRYA